MNTRMLRRARVLFASEYVPESQNRINRLRWVRSLRMLGKKWLLAEPQRKAS